MGSTSSCTASCIASCTAFLRHMVFRCSQQRFSNADFPGVLNWNMVCIRISFHLLSITGCNCFSCLYGETLVSDLILEEIRPNNKHNAVGKYTTEFFLFCAPVCTDVCTEQENI